MMARKRLSSRARLFLATSPPIGEGLSLAALDRLRGASRVVDAAAIPTERDFIAIAA